jgi:hypothetical protein
MGYQSKRKRRRKRRRHDEELTSSTPVAVKDPIDDVQNALKNPALMKNPETILAMQSVLGNQAVQRALQANDIIQKKQSDEEIQKRRSLRIERYKTMSLMLNVVFPQDKMIPMMQMYKEIGFDPQRELLLEIQQGKYPQYLPVGDDSVFSLDEEQCEQTGQQYFLGETVKNTLLRLQMILMMVVPERADLQKIMDNPVVMVTDITNDILGVTGLQDSAELENVSKDLNAHVEEYPAIARFLTEEQAKLLMDIEPENFRIMFEDILRPKDVEEIIRGLKIFQKQLKTMVIRGHILKRPRWEEAKRRGMLNKDSSSFDQVLLTLNNLPH